MENKFQIQRIGVLKYCISISETHQKKTWGENIFENMSTEKFPELIKDIIHSQEAKKKKKTQAR